MSVLYIRQWHSLVRSSMASVSFPEHSCVPALHCPYGTPSLVFAAEESLLSMNHDCVMFLETLYSLLGIRPNAEFGKSQFLLVPNNLGLPLIPLLFLFPQQYGSYVVVVPSSNADSWTLGPWCRLSDMIICA
ncbi:hypothetical protein FRX31_009425 [Thalictrum thalictroides]|uniref:Uncharacterized protein n=1 Tax=Thalictrum thalictroides TaxID=46969 RepID=A0A7J6WWQ6_THATH|nr:hypothetical protein FRX31_009425 [Thalictrum thalictroides]